MDLSAAVTEIQNQTDELKKAASIDSLLLSKIVTVKELSKMLSVSPAYVVNVRRTVNLPPLITDGYYARSISASHLRILSRLKNESQMIEAYEKILSQGLTTSQTEELVRTMLYTVEPGGSRASSLIIDKIKYLFQKIDQSAKVSVSQTRVRTRITIDLYGGLAKTTRFLRKLSDMTQD